MVFLNLVSKKREINVDAKRWFRIRNIIGVGCFLLALFFNTWIVGWLIASDHQISAFRFRVLIYALQLICIAAGLVILLHRERYLARMTLTSIRRFPRFFAMLLGVCCAVLIWGGLEACLYGAEKMSSVAPTSHYEGGYPHELFLPEDTLGIQLRKNQCVSARFIQGEKTIFDVTYCSDDLGRRSTPVPSESKRDFHGLFLGDSFTFGLGVEDDETLPAQVAVGMPNVNPYNYGMPGREPGYALGLLQERELHKEIQEERGFALYTFMDFQVSRSIGTMRILGSWGGNILCYKIENGQAVRLGLYDSVFPWRCRICRLLNKSRVLKRVHLDIPFKRKNHHCQFVAKLLQAAKEAYLRQFPEGDFFVLLYPCMPEQQAFMRPFLEEVGVECLNISLENLPPHEESFFPEDGHPNAKMHALTAQRCVEALHRQLGRE